MKARVPLRKLNPEQTTLQVSVVVTKEFKVRMAVGLALIKLAGKIMGVGIEVNRSVTHPDG